MLSPISALFPVTDDDVEELREVDEDITDADLDARSFDDLDAWCATLARQAHDLALRGDQGEAAQQYRNVLARLRDRVVAARDARLRESAQYDEA